MRPSFRNCFGISDAEARTPEYARLDCRPEGETVITRLWPQKALLLDSASGRVGLIAVDKHRLRILGEAAVAGFERAIAIAGGVRVVNVQLGNWDTLTQIVQLYDTTVSVSTGTRRNLETYAWRGAQMTRKKKRDAFLAQIGSSTAEQHICTGAFRG